MNNMMDTENKFHKTNSEIIERIKKRYETKRIKIEKLLTLGYTTSGDP
jgi:hypothetical protein